MHDPYGGLMALIGMSIVFVVLLLLFVVFTNTPRLYTPEFKLWLNGLFSKRKASEHPDAALAAPQKVEDLSGEVNAAIAAAIYLYRSEMHDYENTVLTISKVSRTYSPWSSKIYGLRNLQH
ncbi:MAG: hypothetical protein EA361_05195 [Bacteroidetes bacterium]|nr:MAG: hypothetical protein EA361_05195 [Bacteroidota bacterium]